MHDGTEQQGPLSRTSNELILAELHGIRDRVHRTQALAELAGIRERLVELEELVGTG